MRFETHVIHDKWIFIEHERTGTFFTIESKENTMSPRSWRDGDKTYTPEYEGLCRLICCPSDASPEVSECWFDMK